MSAATWIVDALLASTLLMAAVLLVRGTVRRAFGPQVAYALWALPALRLLLPPLPAGWWHAAAAAPITRAGETVTVYLVEPVAAVAAPAAGPSAGLLLALAWATGGLLFLGWHVVRHRRFCRAVLRGAEPLEEHGGVVVVASAAASGPLAFGIRRRMVVFPTDFTVRYDADERALALQHELGHHARRDLLANWAALVVLALHWFSPIAWAAFRAFRADQELANDAGVLARCAPAARLAYGRAIVKAASPGFAVATACHLHTIADLKGRLRMLTNSRASRRRVAAGSGAVAVLVATGLGLTASSSAAERISATLQAPTAPLASTAPAAPETPPAPPTPVAPASPAASPHRHVRHVVVVRDGETRTYDGPEADAYIAANHLPVPPAPPAGSTLGVPPLPPVITMRRVGPSGRGGEQMAWQMAIPRVADGHCPGDAARPMVENRTEGGHQLIVICRNRIEAMSRDAAAQAARADDMARSASVNARVSLAMARGAIERDRNLSAEQRAQALAGIAQAEAELHDPANN